MTSFRAVNGQYLDEKDRLGCPIGLCKLLYFREMSLNCILILLLVPECDYVPQRCMWRRFSLDLVTFMVGQTAAKCDQMSSLLRFLANLLLLTKSDSKNLPRVTKITLCKDTNLYGQKNIFCGNIQNDCLK